MKHFPSYSIFQELTQTREEDLYEMISEEHAKQLHWKETLRIEEQQLKAAKKKEAAEKEITQKRAMLERKTKNDLELSQEESRRKAVVEDLAQIVATGGDKTNNCIAKALAEFLSK